MHGLISENYPKARLVSIYDMFKRIEYAGLNSEHPQNMVQNVNKKNFYVIVTAYLAARVAPDMCREYGLSKDRLFLCEREFVRQEDILGEKDKRMANKV